MINRKTIYKIDTKGKERFITLSTEGNLLIQESGIVGSDKTVINKRVCKAKNIGRTNATTAEEQALKELESKYKDRLAGEYFNTLEEAKKTEVVGAMLAKDYFKEEHKIDWSKKVYIQPKLDGMRCLAVVQDGKVKLLSRDYKDILLTCGSSMIHIVDALEKLELENCILDGELYADGYNFQENMKMIKKARKNSNKVHYHMYDIAMDKPYKERIEKLMTITHKRQDPIRIVDTEPVTKE